MHEETIEAMRQAFDTNMLGMFLGMKTVIPGMIAAGGGAIVNVSSVWGCRASRTTSPTKPPRGRR